ESSSIEDLKPRNIVKAKVIQINRDYVTVDINFKSHGNIPRAEFENGRGEMQAKVGDEVDVFIVALEDEHNQLVLSRERAHQTKVWAEVEDIFKNDEKISGIVVQKVKGGLQVDIGIPAFLPGSQVDVRPHKNLDKFLGEEFTFKVLKITKDKGNIVLSRRIVLMSERDKLRAETLKVLSEGVVMEGTVKNITDYGAFIDLGGLDGLLHITDVSWSRIQHPSEKLTVGQVIPVVVLKYDEEKERVSLGIKQLSDDPWEKASEKYTAETTVKGKVVELAEYGAYVELEEGIDGLIQLNDFSWTKKYKHPNQVVKEGDEIEAYITTIDDEQRLLNLSVKHLSDNPWDSLAKRIPSGTKISGEVRSIMEFGIFVEVENGIDGLVHVSDFSWTKKIKDPEEIAKLYKKGDKIDAIVLDIDKENERLSLGIKQLEEDPWGKIAQRYPVGSKVQGKVTAIAEFGIFVEIEEGIEGLIHSSQLGIDKDQKVADVYPVGQEVESQVINIDRNEHRISLSIKSLSSNEDISNFIEEVPVTFGDLLREKMDSNN
ncbi:UNVERIFIED_CONTAM: hypothetical protein GTU68_051085, partial [Idotea baltica]|nr:hypothetical protein [Idotea baltica]